MPANGTASRYELREVLGEGGMGVVYRAHDNRTNTDVALKTLKDVTDLAVIEMFKREWAELGKIPHPNIVDIRDVDEIDDNGVRKPCFIMPLLPGCTLASLIKSSSPRLTVDFVVNVVCQVCKGLQAAHEKDLVHRDIKPSNIFIMDDDTAKIIDFGLVHAIGNKSTTGLKGTWQYMAPEQIDGSQNPNRSFDIYSLGVVAYEALTGHQPFRRAEFRDTVEAIRHFVPQAISERNPKVPQMVGKAVHVAMAKAPIHRYATAREFAETLQKAFHNQYIERFDPAKIRPRIDRAKRAFSGGDSDFAAEILTELEAEGNLDPEITLLRSQIDESNRQKRIRQLYEAAQTRLEQDEIPLALDKLDEIVKIDPQHSEALKLRKKIEAQRNQQQVSDWLSLARKHLANHDFSETRRALKEVFNLKYDDPEAARLKSQVDAREKEVQTARAEKESLYNNALRHNQNGEISSALSKLEKLLELSHNVPGASVPERDKVFQAFYNDVRTERDRIDNAYTEGSRHLSEKNFDKALPICDGILARYPQNAQFQALKLKVVNAQRQQLSSYIADVSHAVDSEPNLDRRVAILEEACKRYPTEEQFSRQLSLARDLRDLVASIVTRARNYEEQGQFSEAIAQWNTLSNIHPQYPGIDFEINQLEKSRGKQVEDDKKSRLVAKIDRALGEGDFAGAERLSQEGLLEFPQNPELQVLLAHARQGLDRTSQADRLFEQAKAERAAGNWDRAVALLHQALDLDKGNIVVQNTLVKWLVDRSNTLLDTDAAAAEPLAKEAEKLDPEHPSVKKTISLIAQAKRRQEVELRVVKARELQHTDLGRAIGILEEGLTVFPNENRLLNTLAAFQKEERTRAAGVGIEDKTALYSFDQTQALPSVLPPPPAAKPAAPPVKPPAPPPAPPKPSGPSRWETLRKQWQETSKVFGRNVQERLAGNSRNLIGVLIGLVASGLLIAFAYWHFNKPSGKSGTGVSAVVRNQPVSVPIQITPADAATTVDGKPVSGFTLSLLPDSTHAVVVSRAGYQTIENPAMRVVNGKPWIFALTPEPLHISVSVSEPNGSVWLDDQRVGNLDDGSWSQTFPVKPEALQHNLSVKNKTGAVLLKLAYTTEPGKPATVAPLQTKDLMVVSSFGKDAILYSANPASKLVMAGQERQPIPASGLSVAINEAASGSFPVANGKRVDNLAFEAGNSLGISLNAVPNLVPVTITATPKNAKLTVENIIRRPLKPGIWSWNVAPGGPYKAKLTADGMNDELFVINAPKGGTVKQSFVLTPKGPAAATIIISGGTPGATVKLEGSDIGTLDEDGNGRFPSINFSSHTVEISKEGFASATYNGINLSAGKEVQVPGVRKLSALAGYIQIKSVTPAVATLAYRRPGEEKTPIPDISKAITLPPGRYEITADAPHYVPLVREITVNPKQTVSVSLELTPIVDDGGGTPANYFSPDETVKMSEGWFHGKSNQYVHLRTSYQKNTILFSRDFRVRKLSWMVMLDANNKITYTFDNKKLTIVQFIDGEKTQRPAKEVDLSSLNKSDAIVIQLEKNTVNMLKQGGPVVDSLQDDKHDWSHAQIYIKGDAYFTAWTGR